MSVNNSSYIFSYRNINVLTRSLRDEPACSRELPLRLGGCCRCGQELFCNRCSRCRRRVQMGIGSPPLQGIGAIIGRSRLLSTHQSLLDLTILHQLGIRR